MIGKNRIGITHTSRVLGVSVNDLKKAMFSDNTIYGMEIPSFVRCSSGNFQFDMDEVVKFKKELDYKIGG